MSKSKTIKHIREVKVKDLILYFVLPLLIIPILWIVYVFSTKQVSKEIKIIILVVAVILTYIGVRTFAIGSILMYKAFAPMKIRNQCRFHPTCSTYMIICIQKYGLIFGITKGVKRICRCKPPNGGDDWP